MLLCSVQTHKTGLASHIIVAIATREMPNPRIRISLIIPIGIISVLVYVGLSVVSMIQPY